MAKLVVDKDRCMACGYCYSSDPEHFAPDDQGYSEAISQENLDASETVAAVESCPTGAISIEEE